MTKKLDDATKMLVDSLPENLQKLATMSIENGYFSQSDFVEATTLDEIPDEEQAEAMFKEERASRCCYYSQLASPKSSTGLGKFFKKKHV